jgi:hypothetical protein
MGRDKAEATAPSADLGTGTDICMASSDGCSCSGVKAPGITDEWQRSTHRHLTTMRLARGKARQGKACIPCLNVGEVNPKRWITAIAKYNIFPRSPAGLYPSRIATKTHWQPLLCDSVVSSKVSRLLVLLPLKFIHLVSRQADLQIAFGRSFFFPNYSRPCETVQAAPLPAGRRP